MRLLFTTCGCDGSTVNIHLQAVAEAAGESGDDSGGGGGACGHVYHGRRTSIAYLLYDYLLYCPLTILWQVIMAGAPPSLPPPLPPPLP
jgi:hypothetical protein